MSEGVATPEPSTSPKAEPRWLAPLEIGLLVLVGIVWFGTRAQWQVLAPWNTEWMLNGDWAATYHGWLFHIRGPWTLPPGLTPDLLAPWGTSVFYTNSVFWLCELGRVIALVVKGDFQLYGLFVASSYAGLALVAWWLLRRLEVPVVLRLAGAVLLMAEPMLPARYGHLALTGQWVVMLQIAVAVLLVTGAPRPERLLALSVGVAAFAVGMEGYLAAISIPLAVANVVMGAWRRSVPLRTVGLAVGALVLGVGAMLWLVGALLTEPVNRTAEGFGDFSADLGTLFNSHGLSRWVPGFPVSGRQGEGYSYLGVGPLLLCGVSVLAWLREPRRVARVLWWLAPVVVVVLGQAFYAASARVTFSGQVLVELWGFFKLLDPLPSMFRTSGRFVWGLHYLVGVSAVVAVAMAAKRRWWWGAPLMVAAVLQVAEVPARPNVFDAPTLPPPLGAGWRGLEGKYRHLRVVPIQVQWVCGYNEALIARLSQVAAREGLSINSGLVGRVPAAIPPLCNARFSGPVERDTIYVVDPGYVTDFHGARCGNLEGIPVCVAEGTALAAGLPMAIP